MSYLNYSTDFKGVVDIFMHNPARYLPFTQLLTEVMNGESELTKPQREMIALHVSKLNDCHYCVGSHRAVLKELGADDATVTAAETGTTENLPMSLVLTLAGKLTRTPGGITQRDIDTVRNAGWSDQTIEDIIAIVSVFSFLNRLVDGFGVRGTNAGYTQGGAMIASHGYGPIIKMIGGKAGE